MSRLIKNEHSLEWVQVRQYCEEQLDELREDNDADLGEVETAHLRGMIAVIKDILMLDQDEVELPEAPPDLIYVE
jgi:hypothetical protein